MQSTKKVQIISGELVTKKQQKDIITMLEKDVFPFFGNGNRYSHIKAHNTENQYFVIVHTPKKTICTLIEYK